jgi:hypothetical protein
VGGLTTIVDTGMREHSLGPASRAGFLRLTSSGQAEAVDLPVADSGRCAELIESYASLRLGLWLSGRQTAPCRWPSTSLREETSQGS